MQQKRLETKTRRRRVIESLGLLAVVVWLSGLPASGQTLKNSQPRDVADAENKQVFSQSAAGSVRLTAGKKASSKQDQASGGDGATSSPSELGGERLLPKYPLLFAALALVGIVLSGLLMIVLAVLWGRRVRRAAWEGVASTLPGDPFWFLRPRKKLTQEGPSGPSSVEPRDGKSFPPSDAPDESHGDGS